MTQRKNSFDKETIIKVGKGAGIAGGAAALTFIANNLGELGLSTTLGIVVTAVLSILINLVREFRQGK